MKQIYFILLTMLFFCTACENSHDVVVYPASEETCTYTFTCKGDGSMSLVTRSQSSLSINELGLTHLLVFDYVGNNFVQKISQVYGADHNFGKVTMQLSKGTHNLYFIASKGLNPVVNEALSTISYSYVNDTFWKMYEVNVTSTANTNVSITLERVITKLNVELTEVVPYDATSIKVKPSLWYRGINYRTGFGANTSYPLEQVFAVPEQSKGKTGLQLEMYGFLPSYNYETDIDITGVSGTGTSSTITGNTFIPSAPFVRNRMTKYAGTLFTNDDGSGHETTLSIETTWLNPYTIQD